MLRRLKTSSDASQPSPNGTLDEAQGTEEPDSHDGPMSSLQKYRSQTMKDYGLMIEYKHLRQHVPSGIYVLPSFDHSRVWYGAIFIHAGLYRNGIFKFTIFLPESYNGPGTYPRIVFNTNVFHPYVYEETKQLDLHPNFPEWDPELHYMVAVLTYLKGIFYMKDFPETNLVANSEALVMFRHDPENYVNKVEGCVDESLTSVYNNEHGSTIRFTKHNPAHDNLRQELFAQLDATSVIAPQTLEEKMAAPPSTRSLSIVTAAAAGGGSSRQAAAALPDEPMPDSFEDSVKLLNQKICNPLRDIGSTMPIPSDAGLGSKEDDARLNERITKARSELSELHKIIAKDDHKLCDSSGPAARTRSRTANQHDAKRDTVRQRPALLDADYHTSWKLRSVPGERLVELSRAKDTTRSDRMRLAELSDEQLKWPAAEKETAVPHSNRAKMSPVDRLRATTTPRRTTAKDLRDYSTDFVQQALNFDNVTDDDDDVEAAAPSSSGRMMSHGESMSRGSDQEHTGEFGETRKHQDLHTYVRQMEETIAQLVQQKDELLRNQAEFDKQASGIFPSLENLNHQLSQIVQGKLLQSGQSQNNDDVVTLHDDMLDELRVQREQLSELEADSKRRKYDAELQEQDRAIEISQIKADVISVVANGKMRDECTELMSDSIKKLQQELQEAVKNMVQRYRMLDKQISQLQTPMTQPRLVGRKTQRDTLVFIVAVLSGILSVAIGFLIMNSGNCGVVEQCHPLI